MTSYDASRDEIVTLGGQIISVQRAETLIERLESAIDTAHDYRDSPELHDIGLNDKALNHLLDPSEKEYTLQVSVSYEGENSLAMDYLTEIIEHTEDYGNLDALICASDIRAFFDESERIPGFYVEIPSKMEG